MGRSCPPQAATATLAARSTRPASWAWSADVIPHGACCPQGGYGDGALTLPGSGFLRQSGWGGATPHACSRWRRRTTPTQPPDGQGRLSGRHEKPVHTAQWCGPTVPGAPANRVASPSPSGGTRSASTPPPSRLGSPTPQGIGMHPQLPGGFTDADLQTDCRRKSADGYA